MARAVVIYNPAAHSSPDPGLLSAIVRQVELGGFSVETARSLSPGDLTRFSARAVKDGADRVVVCGGDGSIREAAAGLAGTRVPLAVIPLGTANILAREMNLPPSPLLCAAVAGGGRETRVGLGRLNGSEVFTFCASCGPDALAVSDIDLKMKREKGAWAYLYAGLHVMLSRPAPTLWVESDDGTLVDAAEVFVLRTSRYGAGFVRLTRRVGLTSPYMRVVAIRPPLPLRLPSLTFRLLRGGLDGAPGVEAFDATSVRIGAGEPLPIQVDGDPGGTTPGEIGFEPEALTLVLPEDAA